MLTLDQKNKIKDILSDELSINKEIYFPYFLNAIDESNKNIKDLDSKLNDVMHNQKILEQKLDSILIKIGQLKSKVQ